MILLYVTGGQPPTSQLLRDARVTAADSATAGVASFKMQTLGISP
jgi:hypothetical protein